MDNNNLPTKRNLLDAQHSLKLAKQGYDLLDKKRQVLLIELNTTKNTVEKLYENLQKTLHKANSDLALAKMSMGTLAVDAASQQVPPDDSLQIDFRNIMGVKLPQIKISASSAAQIYFNLGESTIHLDEAYISWSRAKIAMIKFAEAKITATRLTAQMHHTQKRACALKNVTIPTFEARIKYISEQLEERERDELARAKAAKGVSSRNT